MKHTVITAQAVNNAFKGKVITVYNDNGTYNDVFDCRRAALQPQTDDGWYAVKFYGRRIENNSTCYRFYKDILLRLLNEGKASDYFAGAGLMTWEVMNDFE